MKIFIEHRDTETQSLLFSLCVSVPLCSNEHQTNNNNNEIKLNDHDRRHAACRKRTSQCRHTD